MRTTVLIVEDNLDLRESTAEYLTGQGYHVLESGSTEEAEDLLPEYEIAIVVIDINLPGRSGFELMKAIRALGYTMPLIALTARDQVEDKLHGFDLGLTDYMVKPFSLAELVARIGVHIRSSNEQNAKTSRIELHAERRQALCDGNTVKLTGTEFRLLEMLVKHNRAVVDIDDLIEYAWGAADIGSDPPIRIHIRNLRKKLGDTDMQLIKTVSGLGYMLDD